MTLFTAFSDGRFDLAGRETRCALGKGGVIEAADKREGDGASPLGVWPIRRVLYRPDKGGAPLTGLPTAPIAEHDGWCDAPGDPAYNRPVALPYPASAERMWRDDDVYDLVGILAHNDDPVVPGHGSAISCTWPGPATSRPKGAWRWRVRTWKPCLASPTRAPRSKSGEPDRPTGSP